LRLTRRLVIAEETGHNKARRPAEGRGRREETTR
jgi:hypothetical protein